MTKYSTIDGLKLHHRFINSEESPRAMISPAEKNFSSLFIPFTKVSNPTNCFLPDNFSIPEQKYLNNRFSLAQKMLSDYLTTKNFFALFFADAFTNKACRFEMNKILKDLETKLIRSPQVLMLRLNMIPFTAKQKMQHIKPILNLFSDYFSCDLAIHEGIALFLNSFTPLPWKTTKETVSEQVQKGSRLVQMISRISETFQLKLNVLLHNPELMDRLISFDESVYEEKSYAANEHMLWNDALSYKLKMFTEDCFMCLVAAQKAHPIHELDRLMICTFYQNFLINLNKLTPHLSHLVKNGFKGLLAEIKAYSDGLQVAQEEGKENTFSLN